MSKPLFLKSTFALLVCYSIHLNTFGQYTSLSPKLTEQSEYLTTVQKATFDYFWDFANPVSGLAPERTATPNIVTSGGTGMGLMCIVVASERGWVSRQEAVKRILKITNFLAKANRFHGAWSHWLNGTTGQVIPFGENDNGGDLVETAYLVNGLLVARQYFNQNNTEETQLRKQITALWESVEWDWYASRGDNKLYWHWSENLGWKMNMPITGYNECLITYVLALGSPTHAIKPEVYENTWKKISNHWLNGKEYLGYAAPVGFDFVGPLFFAHYSYLSIDPKLMQDNVLNYWKLNVIQTMMNYKYCVEKAPKEYGYSVENWGLTASDDYNFYDAHNPANDNGTISPTAALSSFPYTPYYAWRALRGMYLRKGTQTFGKYGFYDAYNVSKNWYSNQYLAIDQGPIVVMIENYRSGLIWKLGGKIKELQVGLQKMGIQKPIYPTSFYAYFPNPEKPVIDLLKHPDFGMYLLDVAVLGNEPITIELQNKSGTIIQILVNQQVFKENLQVIPFSEKGGNYVVVLKQKDKIQKLEIQLN